jgi:hypothetical protein
LVRIQLPLFKVNRALQARITSEPEELSFISVSQTGGNAMSQSSSGSMLLSRAFVGFGQAKEAEGCSLRTVDGYRRELQKWLAYSGDQAVAGVSSTGIAARSQRSDLQAQAETTHHPFRGFLNLLYNPVTLGSSTKSLSLHARRQT